MKTLGTDYDKTSLKLIRTYIAFQPKTVFETKKNITRGPVNNADSITNMLSHLEVQFLILFSV